MKKHVNIIPGTTPPRKWSQLNRTDYYLLALIAILALWAIIRFISSNNSFDFEAITPYIAYENSDGDLLLGMLSKGLLMTIRLGIWSFLFAMIFGLCVGSYTANKRGISVLPFTFFVQVLRNIPPLIFIFLIYFFSGQFFSNMLFAMQDFAYSLTPQGLSIFSYIFAPPMQIEGMTAAILALGLYEGVYIAETVRASIESVSVTQREAARSLGFNAMQSLWYVTLPQAKKIMLPPLAGQTVSVFKDSALAALVSLPELTFQSLEIMAVTRKTFEIWIICMVLYFLISRTCTLIYAFLEKRIKWKQLQ